MQSPDGRDRSSGREARATDGSPGREAATRCLYRGAIARERIEMAGAVEPLRMEREGVFRQWRASRRTTTRGDAGLKVPWARSVKSREKRRRTVRRPAPGSGSAGSGRIRLLLLHAGDDAPGRRRPVPVLPGSSRTWGRTASWEWCPADRRYNHHCRERGASAATRARSEPAIPAMARSTASRIDFAGIPIARPSNVVVPRPSTDVGGRSRPRIAG